MLDCLGQVGNDRTFCGRLRIFGTCYELLGQVKLGYDRSGQVRSGRVTLGQVKTV
jgi:hypothetical protein